MKIKIRDITQKDGGDFIRFSIIEYDGRFGLIINKNIWMEHFDEQLRIETSPKRLRQLANEILNYLNREAKIKEWNPTMDDFETKLREKWNEECYVEMWFIDWVRFPLNKTRKIQARRIYEWLHTNKDWLYRDE